METPSRIDHMPLVGGTLVFDFLNTGGGALEPSADDEGLRDYDDLLSWGCRTGALTEPEAARLAVRATERDQEARSVVARAREQRRYLSELFGALHEGRRPLESALTRLRDDEAAAISRAALIEAAAGFVWSWAGDDGLDRPIWPVIHSATALLMSGQMSRAKRCAGCAWWFLDETKNRSRRWCRMEDCGTAEKMRRYVSRRAARRADGRSVGGDPGGPRAAEAPGD